MKLLRKVRAIFRRAKVNREMDAEMSAHIEMQTERNITAGVDPDEARYAALRQFGNVGSLQERAREQRGWVWLEQLSQDLRFGARSLRKQPGFTTVAVLTLAFGIGANTAIFSVFEAVLLKPLPYPNPGQLVTLTDLHQKGYIRAASFPNFADWREQNSVFQEIAAASSVSYNLAGDGEPERVLAQRVSAGFLPLLGISPGLGRWFTADEDRAGADRVAVISHGMWLRRFSGSSDVVGKRVILDSESYTVVGVMPDGFRTVAGGRFLSAVDTCELWTPLATDADKSPRGSVFLRVIGRLKPGVSLEGASGDMNAIAAGLAELHPSENAGFGIRVRDLHMDLAESARPAVWLLAGAVALLLMLVCANVANLFLVRAAARTGEMTVRAALGASRARIVRQLLTESALVAACGGGLGVVFGWWGVGLLRRFLPQNQVPLNAAEINITVIAFTLAVSLAAGLVFGLAPAWLSAKAGLNNALKNASKGAIGGGRGRLRHGLVVGEVALAFMLLTGAVLVAKSMEHLLKVDPGFRATNVLTMRLHLPGARYDASEKIRAFYDELLARLNALPGVESVGGVAALPMSGGISTWSFAIDGRPEPVGAMNYTDVQSATIDYFATLGIPLFRGRLFEEADHAGTSMVALINRQMVAKFWPGEDPVGRTIGLAGQTHTIVGVVGDVRHFGLSANVRPETYVPHTQRAERSMMLAVRAKSDSEALAGAIRAQIAQLDPTVPLADVRTLEAAVASTTSDSRALVLLLGVFAGAALVLAALGLYGVISFSVGNRTREIGIRVALGARNGDVRSMVVRQGLLLVFCGLVLGLMASAASSRLLADLLYEVKPMDPLTYLLVSIALAAVALLALALPAWRATKVDPVIALRAE
ncbi:MAG TPA: ABC transporter permease [Opitutaceae bacterium]|nr:ABC transporter permease [Opitutaceae bacterium]